MAPQWSLPLAAARKRLPGNASDELCVVDVRLNSPGAWGLMGSDSFMNYPLPRIQLQFAIIFALTQSLHLLLRRFHLPRIVSEILAGIILGPTILGQFPTLQMALFPRKGEVFIDILSKIGYIFFIFLSGVKMDPKTVLKTGAKGWTIGVVAVALPLTASLTTTFTFEKRIHKYRWPTYENMVGVQNLFPFPVISSMLVDLKIMNSELGRLALSSALISDLLSNLASTVISNVRIASFGYKTAMVSQSVTMTLCSVAFIIFIGRAFSLWIIKRTPEGKPITRVHTILMSLLVLMVVILTDNSGLHFQYGPLILGLAVPDGPPLGATLVDRLETIVGGLFAPLLVTYCGMKVNLIDLYDIQFINTMWLIILLTLSFKLVGVFCPAILCRVPVKDSIALSFILTTQGIVHMSFYYDNVVNQTFDRDTFSMLIVSVLIQGAVAHLVVKSLYDYSRMYTGYQKRDIQHTSSNSELRVLICDHRMDDLLGAKKVLEASFPAKESPLSIYALHLMELAGRGQPLLIDHQLGQKSSSGTRNQKMIDVMYSFEQQYTGLVSVQQFTSMSLTKFMHHDICTLAFNKLASFILLPFHRKWNQQGKMIMDSNTLRAINTNVLDNAPCSVGILIDRHKIRRVAPASSAYSVGLAFFGGTDDREALAYARRMANSQSVHLTVVRFVPWDLYAGESQWDSVLDAEILKETRMQGAHQDNIVYREERVNDGAETALLIHDMEEAFDLIMVGRRHNDDLPQLLGLSEWDDLPELGPVGDMLASPDLNKPVSVLVMQHQIVKKK